MASLALSNSALAATENNPVFIALRSADEHAMNVELDRAGTNATLRNLLNSLMRGESEGIFKAAADCVSHAKKAGAMQFAVFCNQIAGNRYRTGGNIPKWAEHMIWAKTVPPRGSLVFGPGYDAQDFEMLRSLPSPSFYSTESIAGGITINSIGGQPIVDVKINGKTVRALIDTGSDVAIIARKDVADKLGVVPVVRNVDYFEGAAIPGRRDDDIFLADVMVQSVVVNNIGIVSTHRLAEFKFDAIVGLPFLELVEKTTFVGDSTSSMIGECRPEKILRSTDRSGFQRLVIPVKLKGGKDYAMLDTGMNTAFAIDAPPPIGRQTKERPVQGWIGEKLIHANDVEEELTVLGVAVGPVVGRHQYSPDLAFPTIIGMGAFYGRSVSLDFSKGLACVR